jgi:acetylornithine deacetylase/succinyl-diaminopimelate desuccinylase-like protein
MKKALLLIFLLSFYFRVSAQQEFTDSGLEAAFLDYLRIPSLSGNEKAAAAFLEQYALQRGLYSRCLSCSDSTVNLALSLYPLDGEKPCIVLLSHLDVVDAPDSVEWRSAPFAALVSDSDVVARGAIDAKGLTFMHLSGLLQFRDSISGGPELPFNIVLLVVCGEETGGVRGAERIAENHLDLLRPWVMAGEGGSGIRGLIPSRPETPVFGISVAEKFNLWLRLDLKFSSFGHGAAPPSSYVNKDMLKALHKLSLIEGRPEFHKSTRRMFRDLGKMEGGFKGWLIAHLPSAPLRPLLKSLMRKEPVLASVLQNTAIMTNIFNPPGPPNKISSMATVFLDCRLLPETRVRRFIREIRYGLIEPRFKVSVINQGPMAEESNPDLPEFVCLSAAIRSVYPDSETAPFLFPASSDNNYFRQYGIPVFGIVPLVMERSDLESIHGINERIKMPGFRKGSRVFLNFLMRAKQLPPKLYFTPVGNR